MYPYSLVFPAADKTVMLWDPVEGKALRKFTGHEFGISDVAFDTVGVCFIMTITFILINHAFS